MQMMQQMMGMFMGGLASSMAISRSPPSEQHAPGPPVPPSPPTGLKRPADNDLLPKNIDIEVWLAQLDSDPVHGKRQIDYSQFGASFTALGIYELSDIIVLDVTQLRELLPHLNFGIANRLVTYAQEDYPIGKFKRARLD